MTNAPQEECTPRQLPTYRYSKPWKHVVWVRARTLRNLLATTYLQAQESIHSLTLSTAARAGFVRMNECNGREKREREREERARDTHNDFNCQSVRFIENVGASRDLRITLRQSVVRHLLAPGMRSYILSIQSIPERRSGFSRV